MSENESLPKITQVELSIVNMIISQHRKTLGYHTILVGGDSMEF